MKDKLKTEQDVREYVNLLKNFSGELTTYIVINVILFLIWLISGAGYFWPIWSIAIWGIYLLVKASKLQIIDQTLYNSCHAFRLKVMPLFKNTWEEKKINELLAELNIRETAQKTQDTASEKVEKKENTMAASAHKKAASTGVKKKPAAQKKRTPSKNKASSSSTTKK